MLLRSVGGQDAATRLVHSLLVGVIAAISALLIALSSTVAAAVQLLAYSPMVMTGTFTSHPDPEYVAMAMNNFVGPSRSADYPPQVPDYNTPIPLDTPEQAWPITGMFDYTFGRSVQIGWADLREQIAETTEATDGEPIIVFGYSQSAVISIHEKRRLAALYPRGDPSAPDIQFVLIGDLNRPNGGVMTRFQGAYIPLINFHFNGPAPTDTTFETIDIARQYDGFADFPLYPVNAIADLNALLGILYVHTDYEAVSLDPDSDNYVEGTLEQRYGDTTYYTIPTAQLPLLQPLRDLGVYEPLMALVEPALRVVIETGYDRTINPGVPMPARLIPRIDPVQFAEDFFEAIEQGFEDARDEIESPTPRPAGPTPTERVVTDLVRTNLSHTVESAARILGVDTAETEASSDTGEDAQGPDEPTEPAEQSASSENDTESLAPSKPRLNQRSATKPTADGSTPRAVRGAGAVAERTREATDPDRDRRKASATKSGDTDSKSDKSADRGDAGSED